MTIVPPKKLQWHERKSVRNAIQSAGVVIAGAAKLVPDFIAHTVGASTYLGLGGTIMGLGASYLAIKNDHKEDIKSESEEGAERLLSGLYVLSRTIRQKRQVSDDKVWANRLRITLHRRDGDTLRQAVNYVGGAGNGRGRDFSIKSGVIGNAARSAEICHAKRKAKDYDAFLDELVREYNFSRAEAVTLTKDRWAWLAVPILSGGNVAAVVYLDSDEPNFFSNIKEPILAACEGLTEYAKSHGPSS